MKNNMKNNMKNYLVKAIDIDFENKYELNEFHKYNLGEITKIPLKYLEILLANLMDAAKAGNILIIHPTENFIDKIYRRTNIEMVPRTLRRQLNKLVDDGYLEEAYGAVYLYNRSHGIKGGERPKYIYKSVKGYRITKLLVDIINQKNLPSKTCSNCKEEKPISEFYPNKSRAKELSYLCKSCDKDRRNDSNAKKRKEMKNN